MTWVKENPPDPQLMKDVLESFPLFLDIVMLAENGRAREPMPLMDAAVGVLDNFYGGEKKLLTVRAAPRFGKSTTFLIAYNLFLAWKYPGIKLGVAAGIGQRLVKDFSARFNKIIYSDIFHAFTGMGKRKQLDLKKRFYNGSQIDLMPVNAFISGMGYNFFTLDDTFGGLSDYESEAQRSELAKFIDTGMTTRNTPYQHGDKMIPSYYMCVGTPYGDGDGMTKMEKYLTDNIKIIIPALSPEGESNHYHFDKKYYANIKRNLFESYGSDDFWYIHYMCDEKRAKSGKKFILNDETIWIDALDQNRIVYASIDFSEGQTEKADFTAMNIFYKDAIGNIIIIDGFNVRERLNETNARNSIISRVLTALKAYNIKGLFFENDYFTRGTYRAYLEEGIANMGLDCILHKPVAQTAVSNKIARLAGLVNTGRIKLFRKNSYAKNDVWQQLYHYPDTRHDDIVMSLSVIAASIADIDRSLQAPAPAVGTLREVFAEIAKNEATDDGASSDF